MVVSAAHALWRTRAAVSSFAQQHRMWTARAVVARSVLPYRSG
jgi:hypothetical protein